MVDSLQSLDWDLLNSDQKYEFCDLLLKQTKHRNNVLIVENKNLKNKILNMENELRDVREALRAEERKFVTLNEELKAKMKERQEFRAREEELSRYVILLHSKLHKEKITRAMLEERIKVASPEKTSGKVMHQRFSQVVDRLRHRLGRRRNSVQDSNHSS